MTSTVSVNCLENITNTSYVIIYLEQGKLCGEMIAGNDPTCCSEVKATAGRNTTRMVVIFLNVEMNTTRTLRAPRVG
jgi:hypothetical protein